MNKKYQTILLAGIVILACIFMAVVDGWWQPGYAIKSVIKIVLFVGLPVSYTLIDRNISIKGLFKINKKGITTAFIIGAAVYVVIFGGYLLLKDVFDFSSITGALMDSVRVSGDNFVYVAIYISLINSLLEEFFFRGFAFLTLKKISSSRFAYVFSAAAFSVYHVAIMTGWFSLPLFVLIMSGLFAGGIIFNYLNDKYSNIYVSWFVHMFANFAINTVGFMLFGII